jgi:hypothetical protein
MDRLDERFQTALAERGAGRQTEAVTMELSASAAKCPGATDKHTKGPALHRSERGRQYNSKIQNVPSSAFAQSILLESEQSKHNADDFMQLAKLGRRRDCVLKRCSDTRNRHA